MADNKLYFGDNLDVMRQHLGDETVDLVYLDPPFQSGRDYNVLFKERSGDRSPAQVKAFEDTWQWDHSSQRVYEEVVERGGDVSRAMQAFKMFLDKSDMLAYLAMMAPRLLELHRVLKDTGSIFLHCDPTASHYLKMLMDAIFGPERFINEIVWSYSVGGRSSNYFGRKHDIIFFYSKTEEWKFNNDAVAVPRKTGSESYGGRIVEEEGKKYQIKVTPDGTEYKYRLDKGKTPEDVWTDINTLQSQSKERLGYPTQKPLELLERILKAATDEGDVVLDPFCGCGTTVAASHKLSRNWIGIDVTHLAVNLIKHRLQETFGDSVHDEYEVIGEPVTVEGAEELKEDDPFQFEFWALGLVGARPDEERRGSDEGIDGELYFHDDETGDTKQILISVKSGHTEPSHVRDLRGVIEREEAEIGVLITLQEPTRKMEEEAAKAGFYESPLGSKHPRIQLITIEDLLQDGGIDYPRSAVNATYGTTDRVEEDPGQEEMEWED